MHSEKKIIISSLFLICILSTALIYLMIKKDLQQKENSIKKMNTYETQEFQKAVNVEIETRK